MSRVHFELFWILKSLHPTIRYVRVNVLFFRCGRERERVEREREIEREREWVDTMKGSTLMNWLLICGFKSWTHHQSYAGICTEQYSGTQARGGERTGWLEYIWTDRQTDMVGRILYILTVFIVVYSVHSFILVCQNTAGPTRLTLF